MVTTTTAPGGPAAGRAPELMPVPAGLRTRSRLRVGALLLPAVLLVLLLRATETFLDVDLYWHLRLGREILDARSVRGLAQDWSFGAPEVEWVTTQWLSEVVMTLLAESFGLRGVAWLKVFLAATFLLGFTALLVRRRSSAWVLVVLALAALAASDAFQERPQLFSLPLLVWLAARARQVLRGGPGPSSPEVLLVTAIWANLHGLWVLVPASLLLLALGRTLQRLHERDAPTAARPVVLLATALGGVCLTPVGPALLLAPFRFADAARLVQEWQPTTFDNYLGMCLGLLVGLLVLGWAASPRVPTVELVYAAGLVAFSLLAVRNVVPAAVLLAPVVADRLDHALPRRPVLDLTAMRGVRAVTAAGLVVVLAGTAVAARTVLTPLLPPAAPVALAERLAAEPGEHRVLNEYATGGVLLRYAGPSSRVAIDGRADRYGADYIARYKDTLATRGDWRAELDRLDPNWAVLEPDTPLTGRLREAGWQEVARDSHHVLLRQVDRADA